MRPPAIALVDAACVVFAASGAEAAVGVGNPGDEVSSYRIVVSHLEGQDGKPIPQDWVRVKPAELTLKPGRTEKVQARLDLPTGVDPGDYEGLLAAQIVTKGKGAQVGAAAASLAMLLVGSQLRSRFAFRVERRPA